MTNENKMMIVMAIIFADTIQTHSFILVLVNILAISYVYQIFNSDSYSTCEDRFGPGISKVKNYIEIYLTGKTEPEDVKIIETDKEISVTVNGDASRIKTTNSDVYVTGDAIRIETVSGDVSTNNIGGDVVTVSGDVDATKISGSVSSVSGNITSEE